MNYFSVKNKEESASRKLKMKSAKRKIKSAKTPSMTTGSGAIK
jgi:hypothetical protein